MNKKTKFLAAASVLAISLSQVPTDASAMNPNLKEGFEKCYGVVKAGKNDCTSKAEKHGCSGAAKNDSNPNEWVKMPKGLCAKIVGGSLTPASDKAEDEDTKEVKDTKSKKDDDHGEHDH